VADSTGWITTSTGVGELKLMTSLTLSGGPKAIGFREELIGPSLSLPWGSSEQAGLKRPLPIRWFGTDESG
jgi:hypothetical protein